MQEEEERFVRKPAVRVAPLDGEKGWFVAEGTGIKADHLAKIFDPYFSTKRKGTGLGLAIVRRIAQDHGGEARYQPLESGSQFSLVLPRAVESRL